MWLAALIVTVLWIQVGWMSRCIRREFGERGLRVDRIRWQPLRPLLSLRWSRRQMLYRVWYSNRKGESFSCSVAATLLQGITIEEERSDTAVGRAGLPWLSWACAGISWAAISDQLNLPDALVGPGLLLLVALTALVQFLQPTRWRSTLVVMPLAPVAAVILRIVTDLGRDATSHNLFPFEIAIGAFVGGAAVLLGMGVGSLAGRLTLSARARSA